jgi:hypothetical protein
MAALCGRDYSDKRSQTSDVSVFRYRVPQLQKPSLAVVHLLPQSQSATGVFV